MKLLVVLLLIGAPVVAQEGAPSVEFQLPTREQPLMAGEFVLADWGEMAIEVALPPGDAHHYWLNWTVMDLRGDKRNISLEFRQEPSGLYGYRDGEVAYQNVGARFLLAAQDAPYGHHFGLSFNGSPPASAHFNPFHYQFANITLPSIAPAATGSTALGDMSAWSNLQSNGILRVVLEVEQLDLRNPPCERVTYFVESTPGADRTGMMATMHAGELETPLNVLFPSNDEGFVFVSDLSVGMSDITLGMNVMEGSPGRIEWLLDGAQWYDGLLPQEVVAGVMCDYEQHEIRGQPLATFNQFDWLPIVFMIVIVGALGVVLVRAFKR